MAGLREFIIQNIRCFREEQRVPLCPITLLVGENSTGKTTFLGGYRALHNLLQMRPGGGELNFNEEPFLMGAFHDIHSRFKPKGMVGEKPEFKLGVKIKNDKNLKIDAVDVVFSFTESGSEPAISGVFFSFVGAGQTFSIQTKSEEMVRIVGPGFDFPVKLHAPVESVRDIFFLLERFYYGSPIRDRANEKNQQHHKFRDFFQSHFSSERFATRRFFQDMRRVFSSGDVFSTAPIRSRPRRTYDPVSEKAVPGGEHIPMLMARMFRDSSASWRELRERLVEFGNESGMFSEVKIKSHGKHISDPFQIQVKARGPIANIVDVGYGVSQVLPIVAEILSTKARRQFLLQQPEVHLHPRGQAALASFFAEATKRHSFIIETHSDYIVDRIRICVRKKILRPDDVALLFFNPSKNGVDICRINLGEQGELLNLPKGYGDFFLRESDQLLGFDD